MYRGFDIDIVRQEGALRLEVVGELDLATVPVLVEKLLEAERSDARVIVIDLAGVQFIDSTGLRALLEAHFRSEQDGNRLRITGEREEARRLFALAGVLDKLPLGSAIEAVHGLGFVTESGGEA